MKKQAKISQERKATMVQDFKNSGMSRAAWCRKQNVSNHTFNGWMNSVRHGSPCVTTKDVEDQDYSQYSVQSVQAILRQALTKSRFNPLATVPTLPDSFATHLLKNGTPPLKSSRLYPDTSQRRKKMLYALPCPPCPERAFYFLGGFSPRFGLTPPKPYICHMKAANNPLVTDFLQNRMHSEEGEMYAIGFVYMRKVRSYLQAKERQSAKLKH